MVEKLVRTKFTFLEDGGQKITNTFKEITNSATTMTTQINGATSSITKSFNELSNQQKANKQIAASLHKKWDALANLSVKTGINLDTLKKRFEGVRIGTLKWKQEIKAVTDQALPKFNFAWLSIMFGGMAIQRTFGRIQRSAIKTFTDVMSTVEGASTNVSMLSANFEYLKFTIGSAIDQALGPFMPMIIRLVEGFINIIENNPEAVFWGIVGALTVGTVFAAGGAFMLFVQGILSLAGVGNLKSLGGLPGILKKIGLAALAHPMITLVAIALAIIARLSWVAFNKTPEAWEAVKDAVKQLKEPLEKVKNAFMSIVQTIFPDMSSSWEDIAWLLAWGFDIIIKGIALSISKFEGFLRVVNIAINAVKAFWEYLSDPTGSKKARDALDLAFAEFKKAGKDFANLQIEYEALVNEGPAQFKRASLLKQGYMVSTNTDTGYVSNLGKAPNYNTFNFNGLTQDEMAQRVIQAITRVG